MATMMVTAATDPPHAPRRRYLAWLLLLCTVAALLAGGWWTLHNKAAGDGAANQFQWIAPEARNLTTAVNATGTVKLKIGAEVRVGAQLSGIVRRLNVTVGSHVNQGDVIAEIDSRPLMAKIDQARTQLDQAQVSLEKAKTDYSRAQKLFQSGLIPEQQFDDAGAALKSAGAAVTMAQSGLNAAQVDLAYVEIRAPISGTVASIATKQGETVAASFATPTFVTIIQESAMEVIAMVDEADIGNVRRGQTVTFTTETYPDKEFHGAVTRIAPVATIISGVVNYEVAVSIQHNITLLKPDMTANVNIGTSEHKALLIPARCVHKDGSQSFVYVGGPGAAPVKRLVSVAARTRDQVEINRGLNLDDRVQLGTGGDAQ